MNAFKLYTTAETAELLHVKPDTLRQWHWLGNKGPVVTKIGGRNMYSEADLQTYLQSNRRTSTSQTAQQAQLAGVTASA